jgi:hypothetical protein
LNEKKKKIKELKDEIEDLNSDTVTDKDDKLVNEDSNDGQIIKINKKSKNKIKVSKDLMFNESNLSHFSNY